MFSPKSKFVHTFAAIPMLLGIGTAAHADCADGNITATALSNALGWIATPTKKNICNGYYVDQAIPYVPNPNITNQSNNYNLNADHVEYDFDGNAIYQGNVHLVETTREVTADNAHVYPDKKTGKTKLIRTWGNVHYFSPGFVAIGTQAELSPETKSFNMQNAFYRSGPANNRVAVVDPGTNKTTYRTYQLSARGSAKKAAQAKPHVYKFHKATYTTCPPNSNTWHLYGNEMHLNYLTGEGIATSATLYIKGVPVLYSPYYSFPLNAYRKTGLLVPTYTYSKANGIIVSTPFYWNMAPNYDMLITPYLITRRGLLTNFQYNYMTDINSGNITASVLPGDRGFRNFQQAAKTEYADQPSALKTLEDDSDTRYAFSLDNVSQFNDHWTSSIDYHRVGDDYYEADFSNKDFGITKTDVQDQLLQSTSLEYAANYWSLKGLLQQYQTLHPINQTTYANQYKRLPELDFEGSTAPIDGFVASMPSQYVRFVIDKTPDQQQPLVNGERFVATPALSLPIYRLYGSLTPTIQVHLIKDKLKDNVAGLSSDPGDAIPIFSVDGKLTFTRKIHPFHQNINQTLEPEIYYLYVPYVNQNNLPNFDTDLQAFSYNLLFSNNRFTGPDRVGDANQVAVGLTTRFLDDDTGLEKAEAGIAEMYYFRNRRVTACYGKNCAADLPVNKEKLSPLAAQASFAFDPRWDVDSNIGWNPTLGKMASLLAVLHYHKDPHHLINLAYYHVNNVVSGLGIPSAHPTITTDVSPAQDVQQAIISTYWAVNDRWTAIGSIDRNWDQNLGGTKQARSEVYDTFSYGFQYESCCWAARVVAYRSFIGLGPQDRIQSNAGAYFQFTLKGLGSLGSSNVDTLLENDITNYRPDSARGQGTNNYYQPNST